MAYIVGDPCVKCRYTDCVAVCPVDCFYAGENTLIIHPDECIDCGACEPECPTTAIFEESDLPEDQAAYIDINSVFSGCKEPGHADTTGWPQHLIDHIKSSDFVVWPVIAAKEDELPDADEFKEATGKLADFSPKPAAG